MEFKEWFKDLPKITRTYMICTLLVTLSVTFPKISIWKWIYLDFSKAFFKLQV